MDNQHFLIFPLTEKDQEALGMREEFSEDSGTIGIMLPPSRIRENVKRWKKYGSADPFESGEVGDAVATLNRIVESMKTRHAEEIKKLGYQHEVDKVTLQDQWKKGADANAHAKAEEVKMNMELQAKRMEVKNLRVEKLEAELKEREKQASTYYRDFGETRKRPLNGFQRFMCRLVRVR